MMRNPWWSATAGVVGFGSAIVCFNYDVPSFGWFNLVLGTFNTVWAVHDFRVWKAARNG